MSAHAHSESTSRNKTIQRLGITQQTNQIEDPRQGDSVGGKGGKKKGQDDEEREGREGEKGGDFLLEFLFFLFMPRN